MTKQLIHYWDENLEALCLGNKKAKLLPDPNNNAWGLTCPDCLRLTGQTEAEEKYWWDIVSGEVNITKS